MIGDPSRSVSIRKQLKTDVIWCYFDAFLTSVEPNNFKQAMTKPSWIDAMQEKIHEFERLKVWELVSCPDNAFLIKLKWIYRVKTNESGGVRKNKARLVAQGFRQERRNQLEDIICMLLDWAIRIFGQPSHSVQAPKGLYGLNKAPMNGIDMLLSFPHPSTILQSQLDTDLNYVVCLCARYQAKPTKAFQNDRFLSRGCLRTLDVVVREALSSSGDKLVSCVKEAKEIVISSTDVYPSVLRQQECDCFMLQQCSIFKSKAPHISYHFIKGACVRMDSWLYSVPTEYQLADIFTKPLPRERFNFLIDKLGMKSMSPETLKRLAEETDE
ncbi:retrovirus-related pol polyprotein from transposon TNT 1-94 [Tanacetum coccineum]